MCNIHYRRWLKYGDPMVSLGRNRQTKEYVRTSKYHPMKRLQRLHRVIMEQHLGRTLHDNEVVHHRNGDRLDNRIDNLEVMTLREHARHHNHDKHRYFQHCLQCGQTTQSHSFCRNHYRTMRQARARLDALDGRL
jgi:hypothetical protein